MHPLIKNNRGAIAGLCRLHGVRSLEAFGSMLRDDFDAGRSDVDVLVEFEAQAADSFSNFLDLQESLEVLFQRYRVPPAVAETIPRSRHHRVPQHSRAWLCGARSH
jgi:predicted nucleotidyltransferase